MESALQESSNNSLTELDNINSMWNNIKNVIYETASKVLGFPKRRTPDWFQDHNAEIQELLAGKQRAYLNHLAKNSLGCKMALQTTKAKVQKEIRSIKDNWWSKKAAELQTLADKNDSQGQFTALRAIYDPRTNAIAPVKTADSRRLLTDKKDITEHWKEHFKNLLNQQDTTDENATSKLCVRPTMDKLSVNITMGELEKAPKETRTGKAPGLDGIPSEVKKKGGLALKSQLLDLYNACWQKQLLPQDFKDALIVTIYKKKGDRNECGNHHGISLLSIAGKILAKIMLNRLKTISESILPESKCSFRAGRSTVDMIFTLGQLQEKAVEQQQPLYTIFVDFSKAFDTVELRPE